MRHVNMHMDYYCPTKFTDLQVHVQGRLLYNCCKAYPERIAIDWLKENPGKLFHTDTMVNDRKLMLDNKSCESCHHGCYKYELQGLQSQRQIDIQKPKILDPNVSLKRLQIILSTDCNLSCIYCSPEWSSSWYKDIQKTGDYVLDGQRITNDNWSTLWAKMKQKSRSTESYFFQLLLNEIQLAKGLKDITMMGGEPLLNNQLLQIVEKIKDKRITIVTGLGVSDERLRTVLKAFEGQKMKFLVSGESTGQHFELIRQGLKWQDFQRRVDMISDAGHEVRFIATLSNLSYFDIHTFYTTYKAKYEILPNILTERSFLLPHVMDKASKEICLENISVIGESTLTDAIKKDPTEIDKKNLGNYLTQIKQRRGVNLDFLPATFKDWCGIDKTVSS